MSRFYENAYSEFLKLVYLKTTRIVLLLVLAFQSILAYIASKQILSVGLNATPEINSSLYEAIPPIEYLGFDVIVFGLLPMIVWGAVHSAKEYEHHSLRTSLLIAGDKNILFFSKIGVFFFFSLAISFVSIYGTILTTHLSLGKESIHPILLNATIWKYILLGVIAWTLLAMLAFLMGSLFRTAVVPSYVAPFDSRQTYEKIRHY